MKAGLRGAANPGIGDALPGSAVNLNVVPAGRLVPCKPSAPTYSLLPGESRTQKPAGRATSARMRPGESAAKECYRRFSQTETSLPLFARDWWLDAVSGPQGWDVAVVERGGEVMAALPFRLRRRFGFRWLSQPPLTPWLGPWIRPSAAKSANAMAREKDLMEALIDGLPPFDYFTQNWHHSRHNWLPFYWRGFSQTTRYTYVLPDISNERSLWQAMDKSVRGTIRKAESRFRLSVRSDMGLDTFLALNRKTYGRQNSMPPYSDALVRRLDQACAERGCRRVFIAVDPDGRAHAGEYMVWDEQAAYALMGGADPTLRQSGATPLCLWHAIRHAATVTQSYDFSGSMIEAVERQFRAFGAVQRPYFRVAKANNKLLRLFV